MPREFNGTINVGLSFLYTNTQQTAAQSLGDPSVSVAETIAITLANGTSIDEASRIWQTRDRTLASAADLAIDVFDGGALDIGAGSGLDQLGQAITLTGAKAIVVYNQVLASGGVLTVGNETSAAAWSTPFNGSDVAAVTIPQGGVFVLTAPTAAGFAITDTSDHLLNFNAAGGDCLFDFYLIGID